MAVADPEFHRRRDPAPTAQPFWPNIYQTLHENERNWAEKGLLGSLEPCCSWEKPMYESYMAN